MSLLGHGQTSQVCPQCKIILPINQIACYNCGFNFVPMQSSNASSLPPSLGGRTHSSLGISKMRNEPSSLPGIAPPSSLGISQSVGEQPLPWGNVVQVAREEEPGMGVPQTERIQSLPWGNGIQISGGETPALGVPHAKGVQAPVYEKASVAAPSREALPRKKPVEKEPSLLQKRATLFYLLTVIVIILVVTFAGMHAVGFSLTSLVPRAATPSVVTYPLPKVNPLFADAFLSDVSGWNLQSSPGNYSVNVGNGALTLEADKNKLLWEPLPGLISYSDFILTVNAALMKGDQNNGYGLYIRGAAGQGSDLNTYYRFELYGDGSYAIFKGTVDQNGTSMATKIVDYTLNPAIQKQGKSNRIMIFAQGASLSFIVNGQLLKTFTDASYTTGSIALFASNLPEAKPGVQVQFSQLALYPAHVSRAS